MARLIVPGTLRPDGERPMAWRRLLGEGLANVCFCSDGDGVATTEAGDAPPVPGGRLPDRSADLIAGGVTFIVVAPTIRLDAVGRSTLPL
jgi:hypothetical protein